MPADTAEATPRVPVPLLVAAGVVALQAVVLLGLGIAELASLNSNRLEMGLSTALFFLAAGAGLAACAWGLSRARRFGRGPALMAQLVALGLAWNFRAAETRWVALLLLVAAVVVLTGMLRPASIAALEEVEARGTTTSDPS